MTIWHTSSPCGLEIQVPTPVPVPRAAARHSTARQGHASGRDRRDRHSESVAASIRQAARHHRQQTALSKTAPIDVAGKATACEPHLRLHVPKRLERPSIPSINEEALKACGHDLAEVPLPYLQDQLRNMGPQMLLSSRRQVFNRAPGPVPKTLEVVAENDFVPTHVLAVFGQGELKLPGPHRTQYFPVHSLMLAANCAGLAPLPTADKPQRDGNKLTLPVVTLAVPSLPTFNLAMHYIYTKNAPALLQQLIPQLQGMLSNLPRDQLPDYVAKRGTPRQLTNQMVLIHQLWANFCALGVNDKSLFTLIEGAWSTTVEAVQIACQRPDSQIAVAVVEAPAQPAASS